MFRNEKGFTYPLTLCLLILFSTFLVIQVEQFIFEKKMLRETEIVLKQETYLLSTMTKLEDILSLEENPSLMGNFLFQDGSANYQINEITTDLWEVIIILKTGESTEIIGTAYFDRNTKRMIKWVEKH
jgi:hypothetical protein